MAWKVPLADLDFDQQEEEAVLAVLRSKWLTMGSETQAFEEAFAAYIGVKHAFAVSNCTVALHLAYEALGIGISDEVIVPSLTFVATANAIRYTGATPVFADITSEQDFSISPDDIAAKITPKTKTIAVVHYAGYACDMQRIQEIADQHGLSIVEDVAHAPGSSLNGKMLGAYGDVNCFSFFSNKNMATGEGGMITTNNDKLADHIRLMRSHGMTTLTWDRHKGHAFTYDVVSPGYNYRIDEIRSAIGRVQLAKLPANNEKRRELDAMYVELLPSEVVVPYSDHRGVSSCHIRPILLPTGTDRQAFMAAMKERGIQTSIHYPPTHQFSTYRNGTKLPLTDQVAYREVTLPLYPQLEASQVTLVIDSVKLALAASMT